MPTLLATRHLSAPWPTRVRPAAQAEEQRLSSATRVTGLEAELASVRQLLAESERELRKGRAQWGGDLEARSAEVGGGCVGWDRGLRSRVLDRFNEGGAGSAKQSWGGSRGRKLDEWGGIEGSGRVGRGRGATCRVPPSL
jgi:hypothetical protein